MDFVQVLAGAITLGSALGATVAGFFAYRQKSLVTLLRESNADYKNRVDQLEDEREGLKDSIIKLQESVKTLQAQNDTPVIELKKILQQQHAYSLDSIDRIVLKLEELTQALINNQGIKA